MSSAKFLPSMLSVNAIEQYSYQPVNSIQTVWSYCSHNTGLQSYAVVLANICEQAMHMYRNNFKGTGYTL